MVFRTEVSRKIFHNVFQNFFLKTGSKGIGLELSRRKGLTEGMRDSFDSMCVWIEFNV